MKHVVILGAGFGGLELCHPPLRRARRRGSVTLIDQNDGFTFGFSKLDILFGTRDAADVRLPYRDARQAGRRVPPGADHGDRPGRAARDDRRRARTTPTSSSSRSAPSTTSPRRPGFAEGGLEYYSIAGAERMRDALPAFTGGTILIGVLGQPYKCPPAPFEGAFLLHDQLVERGIREQTEIRVVAPMAAPVPVTPEVSQRFLDELAARDIEYMAQNTRRRARRRRQGGGARERRAAPLRPLRRDPGPPRAGRRRGVGPRRERLGRGRPRHSRRRRSRTCTPWATWSRSRWRRPACSPRTRPASSPTTSSRGSRGET